MFFLLLLFAFHPEFSLRSEIMQWVILRYFSFLAIYLISRLSSSKLEATETVHSPDTEPSLSMMLQMADMSMASPKDRRRIPDFSAPSDDSISTDRA